MPDIGRELQAVVALRHRDKVAGPSNIGNYLAKLGIDATAGLGVRSTAFGANERIDISTIPPVQATYHQAVLALLGGS